MTDYTKTTNFTAKDNLPVGNVNKKINGSLFDTEFDAVATAVATKANIASPTFTGTVTAPTLAFTTATGTNLLTTAIKANDGTASATIADATGVMTIASAVLTTADINGGTFDGVVGGTTPAAGTFTTVTTSGVVSVDDTTDSTSGTTGSIHTDGGIGAVKDIVAGATVKALGDTSAGDAAAMGYTATEGLILTGQGSTYDVTIKNDADAVVAGVPTGTTDVKFVGNLLNTIGTGSKTISGGVSTTSGAWAKFFGPSEASTPYDIVFGYNSTDLLRYDWDVGNWDFFSRPIDVSGGGIYIGGTASANLLDDYEEGTFTPTLIGSTAAGTGTYTSRTASYTKIGNLVAYLWYVLWTNHTGTGSLRMSGLPFTVATGEQFPAATRISNLTLTAGTSLTPLTIAGGTTMRLYRQGDALVATEIDVDTSAEIYVSGQYRV